MSICETLRNRAPSLLFTSPQGNIPNQAAQFAWEVGVTCNFVSGCFEVLGSLVGEHVRKLIEPAALLATLAGIGMSWLGINVVVQMMELPVIFLVPLAIVMMAYFGNVSFGPVPPALLALLYGTILSWCCGYKSGGDVADAAEYIGDTGLPFTLGIIFTDFAQVQPYETSQCHGRCGSYRQTRSAHQRC